MASASGQASAGEQPLGGSGARRGGSLTRRQRAVLVSACAANALVFFDQTSSTVALKAIGDDLDAGSTALHLVICSYLVLLAAAMPSAARLANRYGRRRLFIGGVALFGAASLGCAVAPSIEVLIALRAVQGLGAAVSVPLALSSVTSTLDPRRRGWAVGVLATGGTAFLGIGPVAGGAVVDAASWRWIFALNLPIVVLSLVLAYRWLPESRERVPPRLDIAGMGLLGGAVAAITGGMLLAGVDGTLALGVAIVAAGACLLAAFVVLEQRVAEPLIDLRLLRVPGLAGPLAALFAIQLAVLGVTVELLLYLQQVLGYGALAAGLLFLPTVLGTPLLSPTTGRLADRRGSRGLVVAGLGLAAAALVWIAVVAPGERVLVLMPGLVLFGLARPLVFTPATRGALGWLPDARRRLAAVLVTSARQLGAVLGVALGGLLVASGDNDFTGGFQVAMLALAAVCLAAMLLAAALRSSRARDRR